MQEDEKTQSGEDSEDEADDSDKIQPFQVALRGDSDTTEMMAQFSYGSTNREGADYLNSVSFFGTNFQEISLYCGQSESKYTKNNNSYASSVTSPTNEPSEHLKAVASPKNESVTVVGTSGSLNEKDF